MKATILHHHKTNTKDQALKYNASATSTKQLGHLTQSKSQSRQGVIT